MGSLVNDPLGATEFVRSLFQNVLGISDATEARLAPWIARAVAIGDPLEFYKVFVAHKINTDRLRAAADSATLLPNGHFYSPVVSRADVSPTTGLHRDRYRRAAANLAPPSQFVRDIAFS